MKKSILLATLAITLFCAPLAHAYDLKDKGKDPSGISVTLSATEQKKIKQDLLVANLRIEVDNKDSQKVQDDINKVMKTALDIAQAEPAIKVSTGSYYVYNFDPEPAPPKPLSSDEMKKRMVWKGSQTIELRSKDAQKVLDIVAKLQDMGFVMNGLNYTLSSELAEAQKDELLIGALKKIQDKAALVAKALGKSGYEIAELTIDGSYIPQQPVAMMSMARGGRMEKEDMAAPVAAPSEDDVSLSVSARVILKH